MNWKLVRVLADAAQFDRTALAEQIVELEAELGLR